jgi:mono/diheme cytochrome c family protein
MSERQWCSLANVHRPLLLMERCNVLRLGKLGLTAVAIAATPAMAADSHNGERLAQRWCVSCHVVSSTQQGSASDVAPPFTSIAKMPDLDAARIAWYLLAPHPRMPDMNLTRNEAADLAAYIASLGSRQIPSLSDHH